MEALNDKEVQGKLAAAKKMVFTADNLTWVVSPNWPGVSQNEVFASELGKSSGGVATARRRLDGIFFEEKRRRCMSFSLWGVD